MSGATHANNELSVALLKTGPRSVTDVYLMTLVLKNHLLGKWLDTKDIASYCKEKLREIFASHKSWRLLWHPIDTSDRIDTTWVFSWPRVYHDVLEFFETSMYTPTPAEEHILRTTVKNNSSVEEVLDQ